MKDSEGQTTVDVSISYYEIYNDKVFDLLEPPEKRLPAGLPLREKDGKTIVVGLSERTCDHLKAFEGLYLQAEKNRATAATKLNAHSSRSHSVLQIKVTQTTGDRVKISTASAIDLAGSEDNRRTDNGKERLIEPAAINKSLFVLSQCVDAISRGDKRIPYRESKMTRILSLGQNNGITVMILNLASLRSYHLDTLSSLNVSSRAKRIEVREIENEVVFKQVPRTATTNGGGLGRARQPLRPLSNAHNAHNVHSGVAASKTATAADSSKPAKAFSVYADRVSKPTAAPSSRPAPNSSQLRKRPSDSGQAVAAAGVVRTSKSGLARPGSTTTHSKLSISAEQLDAMVEKKVNEILAMRSNQAQAAQAPAPAPPHPDINEAVQKRLAALERRIEQEERREDSRSDGLRFLLSARQAKERGDDAGALEMYELALPSFPGQAKLLSKIAKLRARLGLPAHPSTVAEATPSEAAVPKSEKVGKKRHRRAMGDDDEYGEEADADVEGDESYVDDAREKPRARKRKSSKRTKTWTADAAAPVSENEGPPLSPRSRELLDIVNSRDLGRIQGLHGVGSKKARDVVDHLSRMADEGYGPLRSLADLRTLPGMGSRTLERAYEGLVGTI